MRYIGNGYFFFQSRCVRLCASSFLFPNFVLVKKTLQTRGQGYLTYIFGVDKILKQRYFGLIIPKCNFFSRTESYTVKKPQQKNCPKYSFKSASIATSATTETVNLIILKTT